MMSKVVETFQKSVIKFINKKSRGRRKIEESPGTNAYLNRQISTECQMIRHKKKEETQSNTNQK